jgi:hypothetical protein
MTIGTLSVVVALLAARTLVAQEVAGSGLARARVRFATEAHKVQQVVGQLVVHGRDSLTVLQDGEAGRITIPSAQVLTVAVSGGQHSHPWTGLAVGLLGGAAVGAISGASSGDDGLFTGGELATIGALGGAAIGGLVGAVVGAMVHTERWRPYVGIGQGQVGRSGVALGARVSF